MVLDDPCEKDGSTPPQRFVTHRLRTADLSDPCHPGKCPSPPLLLCSDCSPQLITIGTGNSF